MERPARKLILKRAKNATEYFSFCEEVGCSIWEILCGIKEALFEPIGMWMPNNLRPEGTSLYTQGVEVPIDYTGAIPTGFETLILPPCKMLIMQGQPYDDENFAEAIAFFGNKLLTLIQKFMVMNGLMKRPPDFNSHQWDTGGILKGDL